MLVLVDHLLTIDCPLCRKRQSMEYIKSIDSWIPIAPYCCDAMYNLDSPEWYTLVDKEIQKVI